MLAERDSRNQQKLFGRWGKLRLREGQVGESMAETRLGGVTLLAPPPRLPLEVLRRQWRGSLRETCDLVRVLQVSSGSRSQRPMRLLEAEVRGTLTFQEVMLEPGQQGQDSGLSER